MAKEFELPCREQSERVWVVRASGGHFVQHFKHAKLVAIGHLDRLELAPKEGPQDKKVSLPRPTLFGELLTTHELARATVVSHVSQIQMFSEEMSLGDMVVTVDSKTIAIGRITGHPYLDRTPVDLSTDVFKDTPMEYQLRRNVRWGPTYPRGKLPLPLERVFNTHRTVFEISKHWDYIYHLLYPVFTAGNELHVSLRVGQEEEIRGASVIGLLRLLQRFEELAALQEDGATSNSLTLQAGFYSPGDIWPKLSAGKAKGLMYAIFIMVLLGGGEVSDVELGSVKVGSIKINGLVALTDRMAELLKKMLEDENAREVVKELKITAPKVETGPIDNRDVNPGEKLFTLAA